MILLLNEELVLSELSTVMRVEIAKLFGVVPRQVGVVWRLLDDGRRVPEFTVTMDDGVVVDPRMVLLRAKPLYTAFVPMYQRQMEGLSQRRGA